jgi:hypothetical protein
MKAVSKSIFFLLPSCILAMAVAAQQALPSQKVRISNSGCTVVMPATPATVDFGFDVDSNKTYSTSVEVIIGQHTYQYAVHVLQAKDDELQGQQLDKLEQFLEFIKSTQQVASSEGYHKVNSILHAKTAKGLSDKWTDADGNEFAVMGWVQGRTMAVLYVFGQGPIPSSAGVQNYLNSFQFPSVF